jgi:hypothetical protein
MKANQGLKTLHLVMNSCTDMPECTVPLRRTCFIDFSVTVPEMLAVVNSGSYAH